MPPGRSRQNFPRPKSYIASILANNMKGIAVLAKADIGYRGVVSSIPPSDLPTLSVAGEGDVTIYIAH
jgi:hypothetical protein